MIALKASTWYIPRLLMVKVAAAISGGRKRPALGAFAQIPAFDGNLAQILGAGTVNHCRHDAVVNCHCDADIYVWIEANSRRRSS